MQGNELAYQIYSPGSVLGLFSNALKLNATINLIYLKGRYAFGVGKPMETITMTICFQNLIIFQSGYVFRPY